MYAKLKNPANLLPADLDRYLELGWFRMGQSIFTTQFLHFNGTFYSALWLRIALDKIENESTKEKLFKANAKFRTNIQPASIDNEREALFQKYKKSLPFETSASVNTLLMDDIPHSVYSTFEVTVYDGDKLIACGYFDLGHHCAAGISSFYDPEYKKYSLGKYIIYRKIEYCRQKGFQYFYPGYFVPGYKVFDYKLTIGKKGLQFFDIEKNTWQNLAAYKQEKIPLSIMEIKLKEIKKALIHKTGDLFLVKYQYFDAGLLPDLSSFTLLDYPLLLHFPQDYDAVLNPVIVYDVRTGLYHLIACNSLGMSPMHFMPSDIYNAHLLEVVKIVFSASTVNEFIIKLEAFLGGAIT